MQNYDCGIESQYIVPQNYASVAQYSKRRNILYDNYLEMMQKIFTVYREFSAQTLETFKQKTHEKSIYVKEFKSFIRKFAEVIKNTSIYQIDCITDLLGNRQDILTKATSEIISKVELFSKPQKIFKAKNQELSNIRQEVQKQYSNLKSESSQAGSFYNTRIMKTKSKAISQQITQINQLQKQLQKTKHQISNNSDEFQKYLIDFRKKLLQNKYHMLNNMIDQSKHYRNCLTQILLLLCQCVNTKMQYFMGLVKYPKDDTISMTQSKGRKKGEDIDTIVSNLINSIQQYNHLIDEVIALLKAFDSSFKKVNNKIQQIFENNKKYFLDNLNSIYSNDETPVREVTQTLAIYQYFTTKLVTISDRLYQSCNKLNLLKQNVKKHADVTLSLIRSTPISKGKQQSKLPQVQQIYNQISYDFVTEILSQVYRNFKEVLIDLKTYFNEKYYKKKKMKVEDSMDISHIDQTMVKVGQKKKPCKKQLWLWRDWRDKANYNSNVSQINDKQISKFISTIKTEQQSKQVEKYECVFQSKKDIKGILKVCQKSLQFISLSGGSIGASNVQLIIPYNQISSISIKVRIFEKFIAIQTEKGQIGFSKFANLQAANQLISTQIQKSSQGGKEKIVKKAAVQLLPQQIDFINKNREKIAAQRPKIDGMIKIKDIFVNNITVDQVYEFIYSDKPFTVLGKQQDSFFAYAMKKAKNLNYTTTPYDKPGPQFYTRNPQVKFTNCPLFSTRKNQFDHPLPPIPFMPKTCHCSQTLRLFWISNEQFDVEITSQSSGAPYADTFYAKTVHKIYKQGTGVKIQLLGNLFFVKQFGMKGMIKSKGQVQMVQGGVFTINEMQRVLNIVSGNSSAEQQIKQQKVQQMQNKQQTPVNQLSKLKNQNKLLIIALVAVFVINIILRFIIK